MRRAEASFRLRPYGLSHRIDAGSGVAGPASPLVLHAASEGKRPGHGLVVPHGQRSRRVGFQHRHVKELRGVGEPPRKQWTSQRHCVYILRFSGIGGMVLTSFFACSSDTAGGR